MILSVTGHRPDKLAKTVASYERDIYSPLLQFTERALIRLQPTEVITGMAVGFDQVVAQACINQGIPFIAAVPFAGQSQFWPRPLIEHYNYLLSHAVKKYCISKGDFNFKTMQIRNEWMVDNSDGVLALWNGSPGGTANCVTYARKMLKRLDNLWGEWEASQDESLSEII